jgi:transcriptional regulator with XRE-family HTH domain
MRDREPTIRSRELGEGLRRAMEYAGFNQSSIARELEWSAGRVSRLLAGKRGGSVAEVSAFLATCGIRGKEYDRLMALCTDNERPGWLQQHGSYLPRQLRTLMDHENKAVTYADVQPLVIPGLLQTGDYARAVISRVANVREHEIEDRVQARLGRQSLLSRTRPPRFTFYIHEFVLRLPVGSAPIMSDQLHRLLRESVRPYLTLRVIPSELGAHAVTAGPFMLMEFKGIKPVVYIESETSSLFLETPIEIDSYRKILASLEASALDEGQSRELIATLATELYAD